jgi:hypothetical protein
LLSLLQQKEHINLLEMKAVHLALSHFRTTLHLKSLVLATDYYRSSLSEKPGRHSLFQPVFSLQGDSPSLLGTSDSTGSVTVVAYLKNQGGTHCFSLYSLCREILLRCSELQIQLAVRHIPGHLNVLADTLVTLSSTSEHGMGVTTTNFQCHQSSLGSSSSGSVCCVSEPQAGHFRFSSSRSSSIRCRRNVNLLERNACLRIPPLSNCLHGAHIGSTTLYLAHGAVMSIFLC